MFKRIIKHYTKSKDPNSKKFRRGMAEQICGHHIKYVTERKDNVEEIIGREGGLNIRDDEFIVFASQNIIFRTKIDDLRASELLSKDGVVISGPDLEHGGVERTIIVYYVYYR
jgi:hypothetical protein